MNKKPHMLRVGVVVFFFFFFFFFMLFPLLQVDFCKGVSSSLYLSIPVFLLPFPRNIIFFLWLPGLGLATMFVVCPESFSTHLKFQYSFTYSMIIHSFDMSKPSQSISLDLVLHILHPDPFSVVCISVCLSVLEFPAVALKNFISGACILLSYLLVHVPVSTPFNSIFFKYTMHIVVLHCVSLFHNMLFIKWYNLEAFLILLFTSFCILPFLSTMLQR
jgi:hypothetical protein